MVIVDVLALKGLIERDHERSATAVVTGWSYGWQMWYMAARLAWDYPHKFALSDDRNVMWWTDVTVRSSPKGTWHRYG